MDTFTIYESVEQQAMEQRVSQQIPNNDATLLAANAAEDDEYQQEMTRRVTDASN